MTVRLSIINFAGIARTEVAVGTSSDASIDCTTLAATPLIGSVVAAPGETNVGIGLTTGSAGVAVDEILGALGFTAGVAATGFGSADEVT